MNWKMRRSNKETEEIRNKKRKLAKIRREELYEFYSALFGTKGGNVVLDDLLGRGHIYETSYISGLSATDVAYREGQKEMALYILKMVNESNSSIIPQYAARVAKFKDEQNK